MVPADLDHSRRFDAKPPRPVSARTGKPAGPHVLVRRRHGAGSLGTGTTSVAAARAGRNSVGVEVDGEYLELARRRFLDETGGLSERAGLEAVSD